MKIHSIKITKEAITNLFSNGVQYYEIKNGLSPDAKLIGLGRIPQTNDYELMFEAESGVEINDGDVVQYKNPEFTKLYNVTNFKVYFNEHEAGIEFDQK